MDLYLYKERDFTREEIISGGLLMRSYGFESFVARGAFNSTNVFGDKQTHNHATAQFFFDKIQIEFPSLERIIYFEKEYGTNFLFFQSILDVIIKKFEIKEYNSIYTINNLEYNGYDLRDLAIRKA